MPGPSVVDTLREIKNDTKSMGIKVVGTFKGLRQEVGNLGARDHIRNTRRNMGLKDRNAIQRMRESISSQDTAIQRPRIFLDDDMKPKYPIMKKMKGIFDDDDEDDTSSSNATSSGAVGSSSPAIGDGVDIAGPSRKKSESDQDIDLGLSGEG